MIRALTYALLGVLAITMLAFNLTGARALLRAEEDASRLPLIRAFARVAEKDAEDFAVALRFDPAELARRAGVQGAGLNLALAERDAALGNLDAVTLYEKGASIQGWIVADAEDVEIEFVGAAMGNRVLSVQQPREARPDVEAYLDRDLSYDAGFNLWVRLPKGSRGCGVGIFAITSAMTIDWLHEKDAGCLADMHSQSP